MLHAYTTSHHFTYRTRSSEIRGRRGRECRRRRLRDERVGRGERRLQFGQQLARTVCDCAGCGGERERDERDERKREMRERESKERERETEGDESDGGRSNKKER
jgi:hypothetical protein